MREHLHHYNPFDFNGVDARYVKVAISNLSDDGKIKMGQSVVTEIFMFGLDESGYNEALAKAKEEVLNEKYTDASRNTLQEAIDTAEAAVAAERIQSVIDAQTTALKTATGKLLLKTEYLTDLRVLSGQKHDVYDENYYETLGYNLVYAPVNEAASYTWDSANLGADGKFASDPECTKLTTGNIGKWSDNATYTVWNTSYTSYWDLGDVYPLNKVDIWSRYNLCNVKIYAKANEEDEYALVASHQAADNSAGANALNYNPFDFNGVEAQYVKIAVSNVSDDGKIKLGQSVVTEVFIFGLDSTEYKAVLNDAKEKIADTKYTKASRDLLETAIAEAETAVSENMTQETFDEQAVELKKAINNLIYSSSVYVEKNIVSGNVQGNINDINKYKDFLAYDLTYMPTGATYKWTEGNFSTQEDFANDTRLQGGDFWNATVSNGTAWGSTSIKTDTMVWDLKSVLSVSEIDIFQRLISKYNTGIQTVTIESSVDGKVYTPVTTKTMSNETYKNYDQLGFEQIIFENEIEAQFIKITFDAGSYNQYVLAEVVILGEASLKYPVTVTSGLYEDDNFETVTTLEGQEYIYITLGLYNETDSDYENLKAYSAVYDGDGKLVKMAESAEFTLEAKSEYSPEIELTDLMGLSENYTLKTFIWQGMSPVSRVTEF